MIDELRRGASNAFEQTGRYSLYEHGTPPAHAVGRMSYEGHTPDASYMSEADGLNTGLRLAQMHSGIPQPEPVFFGRRTPRRPGGGGPVPPERCFLMPGSQSLGFCLYLCPRTGTVRRLGRDGRHVPCQDSINNFDGQGPND